MYLCTKFILIQLNRQKEEIKILERRVMTQTTKIYVIVGAYSSSAAEKLTESGNIIDSKTKL